jgi:hypothetical protein
MCNIGRWATQVTVAATLTAFLRQRLIGEDKNAGELIMSYKGKTQLTFVIMAPPDLVGEGDRIFKSHASWMEATHHRDGEKALLSYTVSKAPELSNPFDSSSAPTGNTCFILDEYYESSAGVADHFQQAMSSWQDFFAFVEWLGKCQVSGVPVAPVFNALW